MRQVGPCTLCAHVPFANAHSPFIGIYCKEPKYKEAKNGTNIKTKSSPQYWSEMPESASDNLHAWTSLTKK